MNSHIDEIIRSLEHIKDLSSASFGSLNSFQLNWKPAEQKWSIGQCFDHLIVSNKEYFRQLESLGQGKEDKNIWKHIPGLPGLFGHLLLKSVSEESKRKLKAPKIFEPSLSEIRSDIISEFVVHQNRLIEFIRKLEKADLRKTKITSPVSRFITYSLSDTFNILAAHEHRHYKQAMNVKHSANFPR